MGFKTVLVHIGPDPDSRRRVEIAAEFAARQQARLRGLFICLPMQLPGLPYGVSMRDAVLRAEEVSAEAREHFEAVCGRNGLRHEFLMELGDAAEHLALHGRYADAIVISQDAPRSAFNDFHADLTEFLPFAASAPVIVLPQGRDSVIDPTRILIAWKSSREAASAVRDALPLLKEAEGVTVVCAQPHGSKDLPGAGLSQFLAEHGVQVELRTIGADDHDVGDTILEEARIAGAGLIVMGVYGHSRLRTRILGGVSKYVLQHTKVPLLVTH
ncbi:universal stress protein [Rhodospirillum centenum]|uniref:Universal stress protein family n=1 Tax=Rhodospirillum centenum (strain ATCC 51521 / SW) TaxID=414684 RepID=B6INU0_RHOCS|nr:universal stress protein [Rhodospirillum centenum]ACI99274.1 universal stress protein family [Rhodospirillum centenum SW]